MENYSTLQRLGKGAQGSVFLVNNKLDKQKYVLKKIECTDESEANKAFKEAMALCALQHPYVCGYKEFFVEWDKEECSMFVCIVMQFYENGDLDKLLKSQRNKKCALDELTIKKWIGQAIEALIFVHDKKVIHRDLKPSNMFMTNEMSIAIGDFGVATIMADIRTQTRNVVGSLNWMAPEVDEKAHDERSDIWSLGVIILETMTCGLLSSQEMSKLLFEFKTDPTIAEELLKKVSNSYSVELQVLVREMLTRNYQKRPTAHELVHRPYVKKCLELSGSALVSRRRKQQVSTIEKPIPTMQGVSAVVEYISKETNNEICVKEALAWLAIAVKSDVLTDAEKIVVVNAVKSNIECVEICIAGCNIFSHLVIKASLINAVFLKDVISTVVLAMKTHSKSSQVQQSASALLMAFSASELGSMLVGEQGGIQCILKILTDFSINNELLAVACNALWSLCVQEKNCKIATSEEALRIVCECMRTHADVPEIQESAAATLLSLSMEDDNVDQAAQLDLIRLLLLAVKNHTSYTKLVKNACLAMSSFVETDEESALKVLHNECDNGPTLHGMDLLVSAFEIHKDNVVVVEAIAILVNEISQYEDLMPEVKTSNMPTILQTMRKLYLKSEEIIKPVENALLKMGCSKVSSK